MRLLIGLLVLLMGCAKDNSAPSKALTERASEEISPEPTPYCAFASLPKNWVRNEDYLPLLILVTVEWDVVEAMRC